MKITYAIALTCTSVALGACSGKTTFGSADNGVAQGSGDQSSAGAGAQEMMTGSGMETEWTEPGGPETEDQLLDDTNPSDEPGTGDEEVPDEEVPDEEVPDEEVPDEEVPDEEVPDEEVPDPEYDPCADKACGDACSYCDPADTTCVETDEIKLCNGEGACVSAVGERPACGGDETCASADECQVQSFAPQDCIVCSDGNVHCDGALCVEGHCVVQPAEECDVRRECEEPAGCRQEPTTDLVAPPESQCRVCPNGDTVCPEPACVENRCVERIPACDEEPKECTDAGDCPQLLLVACQLCDDGKTTACPTTECVEGQCVSKLNECAPGEEYDPCAEKACGETCDLCDPNSASCFSILVVTACNAEGQCVAKTEDGPVCREEYDPCAEKGCGDICNLCAPDAEGCFETAEIKACNADGRCVSDTEDGPVCGE